jgi:hypothetical protein
MRNAYIITLLLILVTSVYAQDLIVTQEGDSINCKITKVKTDNIYFTFKHKDEIRSTLLRRTDVKTHQFDYYTKSEVPTEKIIGQRNNNYQHFRFAANAGYSYRVAKINENTPSDFREYTKKLKSGYHLGADVAYYFTEPLGVGLKAYVSKASNSVDNIYIQDIYGNTSYGKMSDDITITFIGPTFSTRLINAYKSNAAMFNFSLGYMGYLNDNVVVKNYKITGSTIGLALDAGYDIGLTDNLSLGFQISIITGVMTQYDINDGSTVQHFKMKDNYESLNRIDLSVGLRFGK